MLCADVYPRLWVLVSANARGFIRLRRKILTLSTLEM